MTGGAEAIVLTPYYDSVRVLSIDFGHTKSPAPPAGSAGLVRNAAGCFYVRVH